MATAPAAAVAPPTAAATLALHDRLAGYAHRPDVQDLLQGMVADLLSEQPDDPVAYLQDWLAREDARRRQLVLDGGAGGASN